MVATLPINRLGYDSPRDELPELPKSARERGRLWSDAVMCAVLTLKKQLTHRDAHIALAAANSILELERTRMRHSTHVAGSESVSDAQLEFEEDEREADERSAARRRELAAEKAKCNSEEQAFAEHVDEVTVYAEREEHPLQLPPEQFVRWLLKQWGLKASAIPKGGFIDRLREHGIGDEDHLPEAA